MTQLTVVAWRVSLIAMMMVAVEYKHTVQT